MGIGLLRRALNVLGIYRSEPGIMANGDILSHLYNPEEVKTRDNYQQTCSPEEVQAIERRRTLEHNIREAIKKDSKFWGKILPYFRDDLSHSALEELEANYLLLTRNENPNEADRKEFFKTKHNPEYGYTGTTAQKLGKGFCQYIAQRRSKEGNHDAYELMEILGLNEEQMKLLSVVVSRRKFPYTDKTLSLEELSLLEKAKVIEDIAKKVGTDVYDFVLMNVLPEHLVTPNGKNGTDMFPKNKQEVYEAVCELAKRGIVSDEDAKNILMEGFQFEDAEKIYEDLNKEHKKSLVPVAKKVKKKTGAIDYEDALRETLSEYLKIKDSGHSRQYFDKVGTTFHELLPEFVRFGIITRKNAIEWVGDEERYNEKERTYQDARKLNNSADLINAEKDIIALTYDNMLRELLKRRTKELTADKLKEIERGSNSLNMDLIRIVERDKLESQALREDSKQLTERFNLASVRDVYKARRELVNDIEKVLPGFKEELKEEEFYRRVEIAERKRAARLEEKGYSLKDVEKNQRIVDCILGLDDKTNEEIQNILELGGGVKLRSPRTIDRVFKRTEKKRLVGKIAGLLDSYVKRIEFQKSVVSMY